MELRLYISVKAYVEILDEKGDQPALLSTLTEPFGFHWIDATSDEACPMSINDFLEKLVQRYEPNDQLDLVELATFAGDQGLEDAASVSQVGPWLHYQAKQIADTESWTPGK